MKDNSNIVIVNIELESLFCAWALKQIREPSIVYQFYTFIRPPTHPRHNRSTIPSFLLWVDNGFVYLIFTHPSRRNNYTQIVTAMF